MPRVVIADDEEFVRYFLKDILESMSFKVVAEVSSGDLLLETMNKQKPHILLLDINMPNLTGEDFLKGYSYLFPKTCFIILTSIASVESLNKRALKNASCILRKDMPPKKMIRIIKTTWENFKQRQVENV